MEAPPSDPFESMERLILESLASWDKETFTVNRLLYSEEEAVCAAVEAAVWVSEVTSDLIMYICMCVATLVLALGLVAAMHFVAFLSIHYYIVACCKLYSID